LNGEGVNEPLTFGKLPQTPLDEKFGRLKSAFDQFSLQMVIFTVKRACIVSIRTYSSTRSRQRLLTATFWFVCGAGINTGLQTQSTHFWSYCFMLLTELLLATKEEL
jgi:hypothetical protein